MSEAAAAPIRCQLLAFLATGSPGLGLILSPLRRFWSEPPRHCYIHRPNGSNYAQSLPRLGSRERPGIARHVSNVLGDPSRSQDLNC
ncbi:hypothetical protein BT67DRAFT_212331 [Trichocladium antarcticum]|uniref:Uncharacterized protein n=1 Tax=Trichocladium antarcticum TaxID=1450529 RepID=A0AAN6ZAI7_9PEZI|nr:hypothetical protein BT67DRAFT_212331 [Trichocladium antarcticum]